MAKFPKEQRETNTVSKKGATIWSVVLGLFCTGMVFWILDEQSTLIRLGASVLGGVAVAVSSYRKSRARQRDLAINQSNIRR